MTETAVTVPAMPLFAYEITDDMKAEFLELIYAGHKANTAAAEIGTTGTRMKYFKRRGGQWYDPTFAKAWDEAEESDEHRVNRQDALRARVDERSMESDSVLIKRAMAELPEWATLRHQNFHHTNVKVELVKYLSPEALEEAIAAMEAAEHGNQQPLRLLEAGADDEPA